MSEMTEVKNLIEEQGRQWEEFRAANDARLKQVEEKGVADAALVNKVEALGEAISNTSKALEDLEVKINRTSLANGGASAEEAEYKVAFRNFLRTGEEGEVQEAGKKVFRNAMSVGSNPDGGYAVPEELDREILALMKDASPMRQVANVITVGSPNYRKLVNTHGASSGWVGETDARAETNTSKLAQLTPFWGEVYAFPQVTQSALEDLFFNVDAFVSGESALEFASKEGASFVSGNGTNKPKGFLAYTITNEADGARAFGSLQYVPTGVAAAISDGTHAAFDPLITLVQSLKAGHRTGAAWQMNSLTAGAYRKVKDENGQYIWQPSLQVGQPNTMLGYAVVENEDMPDIAANAYAVAFGNWKRGYTIADRVGVQVLRDPYTNKPYVGFYTTKRVGGMVADSEAIKLLKVAAS